MPGKRRPDLGRYFTTERVIELFRKLSVTSSTGMEYRVASVLEDILKRFGFKLKRQYIDKYRYNLIACKGVPKILITTHIDTVPRWEHFSSEPRLLDNAIYMRGAVDTKGQIVALLLALETLESEDYELGIALFADEERDGKGSEVFVDSFQEIWQELCCDISLETILVLEPTDLKVAISQWGNLELEVWVNGQEAHGASLAGCNAILKGLDLIDELRVLARRYGAYISVGKIEGGIDPQRVPDLMSFSFDFLVPLNCEREYSELLDETIKLISGYDAEFRLLSADPPVRFKRSEKVENILDNVFSELGLKLEFIEYTAWTDAYHLAQLEIPTIIIGAGKLEHAHTRSEHVELEQLYTLAIILSELISY